MSTILTIVTLILAAWRRGNATRICVERFTGSTLVPVLLGTIAGVHSGRFRSLSRWLLSCGSGTPWEQFVRNDWTREFEIIREARVPVLGICGGHQVIGMAYWHPRRELGCSPIRRLKPGEKDENVGTHLEGYFVEKGLLPVRIVKRNPLFNGLGKVIYVDEHHYCEVKELPPGFDLLASTEECRIQAMKHRMRPLYGVQFHPQIFDEEHPDGKRILENFFEIAQQYWEKPAAQ